MEYPRLLIINNYSFNEYKGGGITLKNLFNGWPKEKLAIAHMSNSKPMYTVCDKYFKIGYNEYHYIFPINKISKEPRSRINGPYSLKDFDLINDSKINLESQVHTPTTNLIKRSFLTLIENAGIREFVHPLVMSKSLREWILEFNPEVIYCQPENISFINLVIKAYNLTGAKIVVHVMDDWPYLIYKDKKLKHVLRTIVRRKFQKLLKISSLRLGISRAMAEEFVDRYKLDFKYFHNPINISTTTDLEKVVKTETNSYLVVYSGRIGWTASHDSIIEFCKCIEVLRKEGLDIRFNIYTDLANKENDFTKFQFDGSYLLPALKDTNFITKLLEADLLLYPVDFDRRSIEFIRLSFPTKLPSYLISGIPVFCYGPSEVYSIRFMSENNLGFLCNEQKLEVLKQAVINALSDSNAREEFSNRAVLYAKNNFDLHQVTTSFHKAISGCIN